MGAITFFKTVSAPPAGPTYTPDACYFVRVGDGFDVYVTNSDGTAIHKHNDASGAGGTTTRYITLNGFVSALTSDTWRGPDINQGPGTGQWDATVDIASASEGTSFASSGPILLKDEILRSAILTTRGNNAQVNNFRMQVRNNRFTNWDGTEDDADLISDLLLEQTTTTIDDVGYFKYEYTGIDVTIAETGMLVPYFQVTVGGTSNRFMQFSLLFELEKA